MHAEERQHECSQRRSEVRAERLSSRFRLRAYRTVQTRPVSSRSVHHGIFPDVYFYTHPSAVREIPRSRYSHATTLQHLRARKLVRRTRSVHSRTRAPTKLVSTTNDFRAFVAKAPHLTIPRQRTLVYGGKLLFSNATAKIPQAISQKRHDGFSFLNDENLDKCLSKKKSRLATPALWLSSPH